MTPTRIIDAHVHAYPAEVAADPAGWGLSHGEPGWTACVAPPGRRSIQGWADADALVAAMDAASIESCVMLGWYWQRQETCDLQNEWYLRWVRRHPGRLIAFASVQPAAGRVAIDALGRALDSGMRGVGEILPQAQGFALDDPWWQGVVELAAARHVPITLHATDPEAGPAAGPPTPLEDYVALARRHPACVLVLAHWGGGMAIRPRPPESGPLPDNLYFDTAASPLLYSPEVFRRAVDLVGATRILYGSDYPLMLYPRQSREPAFGPFLAEIDGAGLNDAERTQILGSNALRLLSPGLAPAAKRV